MNLTVTHSFHGLFWPIAAIGVILVLCQVIRIVGMWFIHAGDDLDRILDAATRCGFPDSDRDVPVPGGGRDKARNGNHFREDHRQG